MNIPPRCLGVYFCSGLRVDPQRGQVNLEGVFSSLRVTQFPSPPVRMSFFVLLSGGRGQGTVRIEVVRSEEADLGSWLWRYSKWIHFPDDPLVPVPLHVATTRLRFPSPGEYLVQLSFDGMLIEDRRLPVATK